MAIELSRGAIEAIRELTAHEIGASVAKVGTQFRAIISVEGIREAGYSGSQFGAIRDAYERALERANDTSNDAAIEALNQVSEVFG